MKWTHFSGLKGSNYYKKNMEKAYNSRIKSKTGKSSHASFYWYEIYIL